MIADTGNADWRTWTAILLSQAAVLAWAAWRLRRAWLRAKRQGR